MRFTSIMLFIAAFVLAGLIGCQFKAEALGYVPASCSTLSQDFLGDFGNQQISIAGQFNVTLNTMLSGTVVILAASQLFPNPYTFFAPVVFLLFTFVTLPQNILVVFGIPAPYGIFFSQLLVFMLLTALAGWWKGNEL